MFKAGNKINIPKYATVLIGNPATVLPKDVSVTAQISLVYEII